MPDFDWCAEFAYLEGAFAPATMRSYYSDVQIYVQWCVDNGRTAFPAELATVCAFLEAQAQEFAPATVRRRVYSIRKIHRLLHLPEPTADEEINLVLRRVRRAKLSRPKQAKGLTRTYLDRFLAAQPETPWGWRNRAMLALGYECLTRRSELVALRTEDLLWLEDGTLRVMIRRGKADPFGQGRIGFTSSRSRELVEAWLFMARTRCRVPVLPNLSKQGCRATTQLHKCQTAGQGRCKRSWPRSLRRRRLLWPLLTSGRRAGPAARREGHCLNHAGGRVEVGERARPLP